MLCNKLIIMIQDLSKNFNEISSSKTCLVKWINIFNSKQISENFEPSSRYTVNLDQYQ